MQLILQNALFVYLISSIYTRLIRDQLIQMND